MREKRALHKINYGIFIGSRRVEYNTAVNPFITFIEMPFYILAAPLSLAALYTAEATASRTLGSKARGRI